MSSQKDGLKPGTYDIKLGGSWDNPSRDRTTFHTLKYDFKPKSVANETETYVAMGQNGDVQVAVPAENDSLTMYKGAQKAVKEARECLLFFNPTTGEVRLEKVTSNINVKKTRPGDAEPATEQYLRSEIARLRTSSISRTPSEAPTQMSSSMMNEEPERKRKTSSSSSSSSSSVGSSSSSDSEEEENFRNAPTLNVVSSGPPPSNQPPVMAPPTRSRALSNSSSTMEMSDSDEDDEMTKQLEMAMASSSMPAVPPSESMPLFEMSTPPRQAPPPPTVVSTVKSASLYNDLALSESSDEDD
ncbi:hypothetical protein PENTCL1PPCAC_23122 [Pristionchus entomophagus]|uniref:Ell-associated factor Eaf n=1 Tax=Pristionchus entomophagus TaxID=358040 RepID=A0AAV5U2V7_9BILA|nr:hypothetical protein PENTCL1PPCAC_23122 [Pristionchus entomophagus]